MLDTIAECNRELEKIDSELKRLKLNRQHVIKIRELLIEDENEIRLNWTMIDKVYQVVRDNSGIDGQSIKKILDEQSNNFTARQITYTLADMRKSGRVENRGSSGRGGRWYIKEADVNQQG